METLRKLYDFKDLALPEQLFQLSWSAREMEKALEDVRARFVEIEETAGPAAYGDFVVIELPEAEGQDGKRVQINIGRRFYDAAFEDTLVGLVSGASVTMPRRDGGRRGALIQIKRRVLPQLTDALIARMGISGVTTMDAYREMQKRTLLARDREKKSEAIFTMVLRETVERSKFGDLTAALRDQYETAAAQYRRMAQERGTSYDEILTQLTPPQCDNPEKREAHLCRKLEDNLRKTLVMSRTAELDGQVFDQESYQEARRGYLDMGMTEEMLNERFTYEDYLASASTVYFSPNSTSCSR